MQMFKNTDSQDCDSNEGEEVTASHILKICSPSNLELGIKCMDG